MKLTISHMILLNKRTIVSVTFSLLVSLCLLSTLFIGTTFAQPETNKIAIIYDQLHVYNSGAAWGCANWNVYAQVYYPHPSIYQLETTILDRCVDEGITYDLVPATAIVEEYPPNEWRALRFWGYNEGWLEHSYFADINPLHPNPPYLFETYYAESGRTLPILGELFYIPDYYVRYHIQNCRHPVLAAMNYGICSFAPGAYYTYPGLQVGWTPGVPPDPDLGPW
jgi:hypothetical protein